MASKRHKQRRLKMLSEALSTNVFVLRMCLFFLSAISLFVVLSLILKLGSQKKTNFIISCISKMIVGLLFVTVLDNILIATANFSCEYGGVLFSIASSEVKMALFILATIFYVVVSVLLAVNYIIVPSVVPDLDND